MMKIMNELTFKSVKRSASKKRRIVASCLFLMLVFCFFGKITYAIELSPEEARYVSFMEARVIMEGVVSFSGKADELAINLSVPSSSPWQQVLEYPKDCHLVRDAENNTICQLRVSDPTSPYHYHLEFRVRTEAFYLTNNYEMNNSSPPPLSVWKYLAPTENIQSDAPEIRELARKIVSGTSDDFEKVAKLAIWVNRNVKYDERYATENKDALWVLKHRRGVCAEFTTLFIALARAVGIPAKYSYVYALGKNGWESHAIAEVYIYGRWIPVDVLWLEIGNLDATHVYFSSYRDNKISNDIMIKGVGVADVKWDAKDPIFDVISAEKKLPRDKIVLETASSKMSFGVENVVFAKILPSTTKVDRLVLLPCKGANILKVKDDEKYVIEKAGKMRYVYWRVFSSKNLDPRYEYLCPLTLNSYYGSGGVNVLNMTVSPEVHTAPRCWSAVLMRREVPKDGEIKVLLNTRGCGEGTKIYVGNDVKLYRIDVENGINSQLLFLPVGNDRTVHIFDNAGNYISLNFTVTGATRVFIRNIIYPRTVRVNSTFNITFEISNSPGENISLEINEREIKLGDKKKIIAAVPMRLEEAGEHYIKVELMESGNTVERTMLTVHAIVPPKIEVRSAYIHGNVTHLYVFSTGVCKNISVFSSGKVWRPTPSELEKGTNHIVIEGVLDTNSPITLRCFDESSGIVEWKGTLKSSPLDVLYFYFQQLLERAKSIMGGLLTQLKILMVSGSW